jgi:hypothetical protein
MANKSFVANKKVFVTDFTLNGVKFAERFPGVISADNGDGTYTVHITIRGRVASVVVKESALSSR